MRWNELKRAEARRFTTPWLLLSDHLKKSGALEKKVLLVVTDGEDNASRESLEQAIRRLEEKNGPTVYTIGMLGDEHSKRARRALREMAEDTGGVAFFPKDVSEVAGHYLADRPRHPQPVHHRIQAQQTAERWWIPHRESGSPGQRV